jgi:hypothetical protein
MLHGPQKEVFNLRFALPSECADLLASGDADIGIIPVIEMARQQLSYFPGTGIACHGAVRSILLISRAPWREIRTVRDRFRLAHLRHARAHHPRRKVRCDAATYLPARCPARHADEADARCSSATPPCTSIPRRSLLNRSISAPSGTR